MEKLLLANLLLERFYRPVQKVTKPYDLREFIVDFCFLLWLYYGNNVVDNPLNSVGKERDMYKPTIIAVSHQSSLMSKTAS